MSIRIGDANIEDVDEFMYLGSTRSSDGRLTFTVSCPDQTIGAHFGKDMILQCKLEPSVDAINMEVRWFRTDFDDPLHLYRNQKDDASTQNIAYRARTELLKDDLTRGIISLNLKNIQVTDEGSYTCFVDAKTWYEEAKLEVKVTGFNEPELELHGYELSGFYYGIRLLCRSEGWYPKPEIHWTNENGEKLMWSESKIEENPEGVFTVESYINVIKGSGNIASCVLQNSFPTTAKTSINISDAAFPPVSTQLLVSLVRILLFIIPLSAVGIFSYKILQERDKVLGLVEQYKDVSFLIPGWTREKMHDIQTPLGKKVCQQPYKIPEAKQAVRDEVKKMLHLAEVIIFSTDWETHLDKVAAVLTTLRKAGLTTNPAKCKVRTKETKYLGYTIGNGLIKPQVCKLNMAEYPMPTCTNFTDPLFAAVTILEPMWKLKVIWTMLY
nr:PREDICTED: butyrophilin subfamily 3 member A2-like [Latimeria chalumnae]|eukprot:XP_014354335.1 PREDICTED: butyrophilin subfamily 3 member A2-like [Latimeria chalumnae]